jgi:FkbM family methyltransferase
MFILGRFILRRPHEPEFAYFREERVGRGLLLDIGANSGQSAASFRIYNKRSPILSVEANRQLEPDLRFLKRFLRRFDYLIAAAGDHRGEAELTFPVYRGVPITGEASLVSDARRPWWARLHGLRGSEFTRATVPVDVRPLDELNVAPAVIKLDVEGYELPAVRGLRRTLETHRPILMVEAAAFDAVNPFLNEIGVDYSPFVYDRGADSLAPYSEPGPVNVLFLPAKH